MVVCAICSSKTSICTRNRVLKNNSPRATANGVIAFVQQCGTCPVFCLVWGAVCKGWRKYNLDTWLPDTWVPFLSFSECFTIGSKWSNVGEDWQLLLMSQYNWWACDQRKPPYNRRWSPPWAHLQSCWLQDGGSPPPTCFPSYSAYCWFKNNVRTNENFIADLLLSTKLCNGFCLVWENTNFLI